MKKIIESVDNIHKLIVNINVNTSKITSSKFVFFKDVSIKIGNISSAELCFTRMVSFLYVLYYEANIKSVDFIESKIEYLGLSFSESNRYHTRIIHALRTYQQHNLEQNAKHDKQILEACYSWFQNIISKNEPMSEVEWKNSLFVLLSETISYLETIANTLSKIFSHEHKNLIIYEWEIKINRCHSVIDFENIFNKVSANFGLQSLDSNKFCKSHHSEWLEKIKCLGNNYEFEFEAQRLIEHSLTKDGPIPITGDDIIKLLNVTPGPRVKELLDIARKIYYSSPCSKSELIDQIKKVEGEL